MRKHGVLGFAALLVAQPGLALAAKLLTQVEVNFVQRLVLLKKLRLLAIQKLVERSRQNYFAACHHQLCRDYLKPCRNWIEAIMLVRKFLEKQTNLVPDAGHHVQNKCEGIASRVFVNHNLILSTFFPSTRCLPSMFTCFF